MLGIQHIRKGALARFTDINPFKTISTNHDLTRAVRLAWVEAALEVLREIEAEARQHVWQAERNNIESLASQARVKLIEIRTDAYNRDCDPHRTIIDGAIVAVMEGVPEFVGMSSDAKPEGDLTDSFAETIGAIVGWPRLLGVSPLFGQIAVTGISQRGGPRRRFGELVFAAFAELIKSPDKYPEAGEAFHIAMEDEARKLARAIYQCVTGIDAKLDQMFAGVDTLESLRKGIGPYLALIPGIADDTAAIRRALDEDRETATRHHAEKMAAEAETLALVRQLLASVAGGMGPSREQPLTDVVTAAEEGASAGDPRFQAALDLMAEGKSEAAARIFVEVAGEIDAQIASDRATIARKQELIRRKQKRGAAAYRHIATLAGLNNPLAAIEAYSKALEYDPDDIESLYWTGYFQIERGTLDRAKEKFQRALTFTSANSDAEGFYNFWSRIGLGDVQVAQGNLADALVTFQNGLTIRDRLAKGRSRQRRLAARSLRLLREVWRISFEGGRSAKRIGCVECRAEDHCQARIGTSGLYRLAT